MDLDRRTFLGLGAAGAALVALGGAGVALRPTAMVTPRRRLRALTPRQFSILAAIADTACPAIDGLPSASDLEVAEKVDELVSTLHPSVAGELGAVLLVFENALPSAVLDGRLTPFTRLDPARRAIALDRWRTSRLALRRMLYRSVTGLVMAAYWADPAAWAHVGYRGPPPHLLLARDALARAKESSSEMDPTPEVTDAG